MGAAKKRIAAILMTSVLAASAPVGMPAAHAQTRDDYLSKLEELIKQNTNNDYVESIEMTIDNPNMVVNGVTKKIDAAPVLDAETNSHTMLPIRCIMEALGGEADYNEVNQEITLSKDGTVLSMQENNQQIEITNSDGTSEFYTASIAPQIIPGVDRTVVGLRDVAELLGATVGWDGDKNKVKISMDYQTKRLIVKSRGGALDFDEFSPKAVIDDGEGLYVVQFDPSKSDKIVRDYCEEINGWPDVEYAEPDILLFGAGTAGSGNRAEDLSGLIPYCDYLKSSNTDLKHVNIGVVEVYKFDNSDSFGGRLSIKRNDSSEYNNSSEKDDHALDHALNVASIIDMGMKNAYNRENAYYSIYGYGGAGGAVASSQYSEYLNEAHDDGCDIINLSIQVCTNSENMNTVKNTIESMQDDVLLVVAAGNDNENVRAYKGDNILVYPAAFSADCENVITVSAFNGDTPWHETDERGSNFGDCVDIAAQGCNIRGYEGTRLSGTSQATPQVTAAAALLKAQNPNLSPAEIKSELKSGKYTDPITDVGDKYYGVGLLNMSKQIANESITETPATQTPATQTPATQTPATQKPTPETPKPDVPTVAPDTTLTGYKLVPSSDIEIKKGETARIKVHEVYSDGSENDITGTFALVSSNRNVATVSNDGTIRGVSAGTAMITLGSALPASFSIPRPVEVTVTDLEPQRPIDRDDPNDRDNDSAPIITEYEWSQNMFELEAGETDSVELYSVYSDGSRKNVTSQSYLSSTDESVATVSSSGKITAVSEGTARITMGVLPASVSIPGAVTVKVKAKPTVYDSSYGDLNDDGKVNAKDVALMQDIISGAVTPSSEQRRNGDVDGDGTIGDNDLRLLKRRALGVSSPFPVEQ